LQFLDSSDAVVVGVAVAKENAEKDEGERLSWVSARVVFGRLMGIDRVNGELTLQVRDEEGEWLEEDFDLPEDFEDSFFEDLVDFLDSTVRVVLLDNTVIRIARKQPA
jgi:hypothetical protein